MTQKVTAIVGLSGVGKTFALKSISERRSFQHLSAGQLIREARQLPPSTEMLESLRSANIDDNQDLLAIGFHHARDPSIGRVILDAHTAIETPTGLTILRPNIFGALGIADMIFLASLPSKILGRRTEDAGRRRPHVTVEQVREFQELALLSVFNICQHLEYPLR
jgi:adenylate kinase